MLMAVGHARYDHLDRFEFPFCSSWPPRHHADDLGQRPDFRFIWRSNCSRWHSYVVAAINRDSLRSTEAGLKYFVLGALSSGMLLYGMSLVYGFTGNTGFEEIAAVLKAGEPQLGFIFGLVFVLAGLAFKISAVPFPHVDARRL